MGAGAECGEAGGVDVGVWSADCADGRRLFRGFVLDSSVDIVTRFIDGFADIACSARYRTLLRTESGLRKFGRGDYGALRLSDRCEQLPSLGAREHVAAVVAAFRHAGASSEGMWVDSALVARSYDDLEKLLAAEACSGYPILVEGIPRRLYYYEGEGVNWRWICGG